MLSRNPLKMASHGLERLIGKPGFRPAKAASVLSIVPGASVAPPSICSDMQTLTTALNQFEANGNVELLDIEFLQRVSLRLGQWDPFNLLAHEMDQLLDHAREIIALGD